MKLLSYRSPESLLADFFLNDQNVPQRVLITGARGAGKTHWCQELVAQIRQPGSPWNAISLHGLISPGLISDDRKVGIQLQDVGSGQSCILAQRREKQAGDSQETKKKEKARSTTNWDFYPAAIAWGNKVLERIGPCDLLLLDELGPLEFERHEGLLASFPLVDRAAYRLACIVVRPELIDLALQRWPQALVMEMGKSTAYPGGDMA